MNCCNDMTGLCCDGPGCPAHRTAAPTSCPPCTHDCSEGRACPVRLKNAQILAGLQQEVTALLAAEPPARSPAAPTLPVVALDSLVPDDQWFADVWYAAVFWALVTASAAITVGCVGYLYARWLGA